ncbi:hypothetical protein SUGI_0094970 [Cryptomeria japonica]|nr:hypothetical protein SUGI_0094970 [Cryptomeria japonica]
MWKKGKEKKGSITEHEDYVKAAAWAWCQHGAGAQSKHVEESNIQTRRQFPIERRPTRFKLEAMGLLNNNNWIENTFAILDTVGSDYVSGCASFHDLSSVECETEICGSSLFDYYELVALSKQLELFCWEIANPAYGKEQPMSTKSWMHHGMKPKTRLSRNSSQVVISGYIKGKESSGSKNKHHHWRFYDLARKLQAFGVSKAHM